MNEAIEKEKQDKFLETVNAEVERRVGQATFTLSTKAKAAKEETEQLRGKLSDVQRELKSEQDKSKTLYGQTELLRGKLKAAELTVGALQTQLVALQPKED